ncbi:MAG: acyl-CoA dehydrogenase, partial [Candidatus Dadabacteria bacterium]
MDLHLTDEQRMTKEAARQFAEQELRPIVRELDKEHRFAADAVRKAGELGFMGVYIPEEWGGAGLDVLAYVQVMEEVSKIDPGTAVVISVNNSLVCDPVLKFGTDEQKETYLKPMASGQKLGCFCLSEPSTGSDAANQKTTAEKKGDRWILNGTKNWISNGREADIALVIAMTDKAQGTRGITAFLVPSDTPGYSVGPPEDKMGIRSSSTTQIHLDNVELDDSHRLGAVGEGFKVAMATLEGGRIGIAAQAVGIGQGAFEEAIRYSQQRHAFNQPIAQFQGLQWMMADMETQIQAARLLTWKAAWLKQSGEPYAKASSQAKLFASEMAVEVTRKAVQIHGGYGYVTEYPVERLYRDAKITEIYEGTSEIQRLVIFRQLLKEY